MRISDWSSDVCSSDLVKVGLHLARHRLVEIDTGAVLDLLPRHLHRELPSFGIRAPEAGWRQQHFAAGQPGTGVDDQPAHRPGLVVDQKSAEQTSELQSLMRISYAVFCLKKKIT